MQGFTIIDGGVAVVIVLSAILAYSRGFVREVMAIGGWIVAAIVAYIFTPQAEPLIKSIPGLDKFLAGSCELSILAAFAAVFAVALVVMSFFTPLLSSLVQHSLLSGIDRGLGFLFGVARGVLLIAVAFVVYNRAMADEAVPMTTDSQSAHIFKQFQDNINASIPADAPAWIVARYQHLVGACGLPADATPGKAAPSSGG